MKRIRESALTKKAMQALTEAVAKVVEEHGRHGIPLAVWRDGRVVSIPALEATALREHGAKAIAYSLTISAAAPDRWR